MDDNFHFGEAGGVKNVSYLFESRKGEKRVGTRCFIFVAGTLNIVDNILWRCSEAIANP